MGKTKCSFGVIEANLNTGPGSMHVARHLVDKYIPQHDGQPIKTGVW